MSTDPHTGAERDLPELGEDRIEAMEGEIFAGIARERATGRARTARRRTYWIAGGAAAAVIAVAAIIAPGVGTIVGSSGSSIDAATAPDSAVVEDADMGGMSQESAIAADEAAPETIAGDGATADRAIITSAAATVVVDDIAVAAREIGDSATAHGGYVESMNVDTAQQRSSGAIDEGIAEDAYTSYEYMPYGAWVTVRVPSDELSAVIDELGDVGEVTASSISRQDVTDQTIDLQARIEAAQASVDRLTELMSQAGDLSDLIAAESALSERQATLESYQQQLEMIESRVSMSSLSVSLTQAFEPVEADPAGFTDGIAAGWNGLVATLNGIVIAVGFLLPWLAVAVVVGGLVWAVVLLVRRRRDRRTGPIED
ncbi:DUF4349 domain-containing protein [Microbacter sp. GSS18]|nr:DUF4349 domain-containing protein [Microbacter sp. GSS18]